MHTRSYTRVLAPHFLSSGSLLVVDSDLLRQAEVPEELLKWKDFSSDKLAEDFLSFKTLKKLFDGIESGLVDGLSGDVGALACTLFVMRLLLHAVI